MTPPLDPSLSALARRVVDGRLRGLIPSEEVRLSRGYLEAVEENEFLRSKAYSCESLFQTLAAHLGGDETMRVLGFDPERIRLAQQEIKDGKFVTWEVLSKELLERAASPSKPSEATDKEQA